MNLLEEPTEDTVPIALPAETVNILTELATSLHQSKQKNRRRIAELLQPIVPLREDFTKCDYGSATKIITEVRLKFCS
jgi:hypothetical protein